MKKDNLLPLICFVFLASIPFSMADFSGTFNFSTGNRSIVTGLTGYTVFICNSTSGCMPAGVGLSCFFDYDNISFGTSYGWCNATSITDCYHDSSTPRSSGTNICITNTTYRTCSSGTWSAASSCSSGQTCGSNSGEPGNCTSPSSSSSSTTTTTGGSGLSSTAVASISFTAWPDGFYITQGESVIKYAIVKNIGNVTLYNVTLSFSGISWYNISPAKVARLNKSQEATFAINFTVTDEVDVDSYSLTLLASTHTSSASASKTLKIGVKPSNKTIQEEILPSYGEYLSLLSTLEAKAAELASQGVNVDNINVILLNARSRLSQANQSLEGGDYATAKQIMDDAKGMLDGAQLEINTASIIPSITAGFGDITLIIIIVVIAAVAIVIVYSLLPPKKDSKEWSADDKRNVLRKLKNILPRKKEKSKW